MTGPGPGSRRLGQTRSSNEYGRTVYYCTGGAGTMVETAPTGLTQLPGGGHVPVAVEPADSPGSVRCTVCGLTKTINYKRRQRIAAAGLIEVDISALPF